MRRTIALILAVIVAAAAASAAQPAEATKPAKPPTRTTPAPAKPQPPAFVLPAGATLLTEVSLGQQEIATLFEKAIPAFVSGLGDPKGHPGALAKGLNLNELAAALDDLTALRLVQFKLKEKTPADAALSSIRAQFPKSKGWNRVLYNTRNDGNWIMEVHTLNSDFYSIISLDTRKNKSFVVTTAGFLDIPKLGGWLGAAIGAVSQPAPPRKQKDAGPASHKDAGAETCPPSVETPADH